MEGYKNYREIEIETASGLKLVVMLYSGAIKFLNLAIDGINERKLDIANNNIIKVQDIISELITSLNFEAGEIAHNLYSLYVYINRRLLEANLQKNSEILLEAANLITTLKDAWDILLKNQKPEVVKTAVSSRLNISG
ncbi:MAG: flagellar export chaperone FliS [Spirochaetes bacterium GWF1_49_6]|jgi:flagellar protein FliS|nr:MAG: flagellar export chaperone FliS [Spirochaetes bacterium GWF1_49_6]